MLNQGENLRHLNTFLTDYQDYLELSDLGYK